MTQCGASQQIGSQQNRADFPKIVLATEGDFINDATVLGKLHPGPSKYPLSQELLHRRQEKDTLFKKCLEETG